MGSTRRGLASRFGNQRGARLSRMKWRSLEERVNADAGMTLAARLEERRGLIAKYVPAETEAAHRRAIAEVRASGAEQRALKTGEAAPEFALPDHNGTMVRSAELRAKSPLVMLFLRGRWCPFDVATVEAWNEAMPQVREAGASVVAISPMTVKHAFFMRDQHKLVFPLLSDAGNEVARRFGLVYRVPTYQQEIYARTFVNLPFLNGDASWELPMPAAYGIGHDSRVRFAFASADYTERPEPLEVLEKLTADHAH